MVREACRAMLKAEAAVGADDAAQAVFVALALKAPRLLNHPTLAGWLHRTARCVCAESRRSEARRHLREQEAARMRAISSSPAVDPSEIHDALDALPEKYRLPLILHHMEGLTEQQTADLLGLGLSATSSRLERGREKLRARLARTGVVGSAAGAGLMLAPASSAAPTAFVAAATQSALAAVGSTAALTASTPALALAKGAIHMLFMAKMKLAAMVAAAVTLVGGAGVAMERSLAAARPDARAGAPARAVNLPRLPATTSTRPALWGIIWSSWNPDGVYTELTVHVKASPLLVTLTQHVAAKSPRTTAWEEWRFAPMPLGDEEKLLLRLSREVFTAVEFAKMGVRESDVVAAMKLTDEQRKRLRAIKADRAPFWGEQTVGEADQSAIKAALARYNAAAADDVDAARADLIDRARGVGQRTLQARDQRIAQVMQSVRAVLTPDQWDAARRAAAKAEAMTRPATAPATRATTQGSFVPVTQRPDGVYLAPSVYINSGLYCLQVDFDPYIGRLGGEARPDPGARLLVHEAPAGQLLDGRARFRFINRRIPLVAEPKDKEAFERASWLQSGLMRLQSFEQTYHLADKLGLDAKQKKAVADIPSTTKLLGVLPLKDKAVQDNLKSLYIAFHQSKEGPDRESARKSLMDELRAVGEKAEKAYLDARARQLNDFEAILTPKQREMLRTSQGGVSPKDGEPL